MRRHFLHIYLAFVGILVLFGVLASAAWFFLHDDDDDHQVFDGLAIILGEALPGTEQPPGDLLAMLERLHAQLSVDLAVSAPDGRLLGAAGAALPAPDPGLSRSTIVRGRGGPLAVLRLPDGRWLSARRAQRDATRHLRWLWVPALLAIAIGIGAYPVARRMTRRLERLEVHVDQLGSGDLGARVEVEGNDEVADLARSFNRAAEQIEQLVNAKRHVLAMASHELRTPLTRIRMASELLAEEPRPELAARVAADIEELDALIDELLLASRLEALPELEQTTRVDLLAVAAEEGARVDAGVSGTPAPVQGNARLLHRMLRNLLENARRHGDGSAISVAVEPLDEGGVRVRVSDAGPGVPASERERIFEPYYRAPGAAGGAGPGIGLGLALVRQIARRHGGESRCLAGEHGGSCFEVIVGVKAAGSRS